MNGFEMNLEATGDLPVAFREETETFHLNFEETDDAVSLDFFEDQQTFNPVFQSDSSEMDLNFGEVQQIIVPGEEIPLYEGTYRVDPSFKQQSLPTRNKILLDDVAVSAIRVERVGNSYGTTVYIGTKGD